MDNYHQNYNTRRDNDGYRNDGYDNDNRNARRHNEESANYDGEQDIYSRRDRGESRRTGADEKYNSDNYGDQYNREGYAANQFNDRFYYGNRRNPSGESRNNDARPGNYQRGNMYGRDRYNDQTADQGNYNQPSHRGKGPKGYTRSDERILEDVSDRLSEDHGLDASEIEVVVQNGEVTLTGNVRSKQEKRHAEDICELVSGVKDVHNQLRVQQQTAQNEYYDIGTGATSSAALATTYGSSGAAPVGAFDLRKG